MRSLKRDKEEKNNSSSFRIYLNGLPTASEKRVDASTENAEMVNSKIESVSGHMNLAVNAKNPAGAAEQLTESGVFPYGRTVAKQFAI